MVGFRSNMVVEKFIPDGITIGGLLYSEEEYYVPPYQRDYSWKRMHLEDFWRDITSIKEDDIYYFGSMLFKTSPENKKRIEIIDGQQRLTTITLFLASIRDLFYNSDINNYEDAVIIQERYIIRKITKDKKIPKLTLNLRNKDMFYHCFQCNLYEQERQDYKTFENQYGKKNTNKLIKDAYDFFKEKIEEELKEKKTKEEKIEYLNGLSDKIREKVAIISITVTNIADAYNIFETINQRGIDLAVADLFKNYLISKATKKEEMIKLWEHIFNFLDTDLKSFLKHYWHSKKGVIQNKLLFKELTKYIEDKNNKVDIDLLTKEIEKEAEIYSAIIKEDEDYWDNSVLGLIKEFNILGIEQPLPLLMIAKEKFNEDEFKKLLKDIVSFSLRYNIICNLQPNVLERKYSDMARRIRGGKSLRENETQLTNAKESIKILKENYPNDEFFKEKFIGKVLEKSKISLYIWTKINERLQLYERPSELSDEHILPKKPNQEWINYLGGKGISNEEKINELIYRIGNQTAMNPEMNNKAKNNLFTKKRDEHYKFSNMPINTDLKFIQDWTEKEIKEREEKYFEEAKKIWKIDFS